LGKAKQLLSESSRPHGFHTSLAVQISSPNDLASATYIQSALKQIGITVSITQESSAAFATKVDSGELPMFIDYWFSWVDDPFYQMYWLLNSKNGGSGGTNVAKYSSSRMDALITSGLYDTNSSRRAATSRSVQQLFNDDVPYIPLYSENNAVATGTSISGVNVFPDQYIRFWMLSKA
jgi:ABC-type transport system substrate-binding protein